VTKILRDDDEIDRDIKYAWSVGGEQMIQILLVKDQYHQMDHPNRFYGMCNVLSKFIHETIFNFMKFFKLECTFDLKFVSCSI